MSKEIEGPPMKFTDYEGCFFKIVGLEHRTHFKCAHGLVLIDSDIDKICPPVKDDVMIIPIRYEYPSNIGRN